MLVRVGFMLPSKTDRSRNCLLVAHSIKRHAACLSAERLFITTDQVQRFGLRRPVGPTGGGA